VTSIIRAWLKGQRRKYSINRWIPSVSPASSRPSGDAPQDGLHDRPGGLAQQPQQPPVKPEINAQPFRDREDKLPMCDGRADFLAHPLGGFSTARA